ncbi:hypothetical protein MMAD_02210 [Mycolicibacterium madagascariense]|uniref:ANTAR domain-containing protein n=1 Tax=Mycolicibacterium madagascariense TaxID=212765 RepID=A0A7I7X8B3_9MYCO|nr:ANTAR domain-containing protein [Mycolicibacterium madagascariense]MCV7013356.1 ANTAR domain-containing protein [Mycolicibacterium madagascariense]BBZ25926.1 hypothetical protein MMAD_02210 [Mycolicibacterium madagascariense]
MTNSGSTGGTRPTEQEQITERVNFITEQRSVIDQAKGMIMFLYGIRSDDAFEMLRQQSQQHNVKLVLLAGQIVEDLVGLSRSSTSLDRLDAHGLLVTAHERIAGVAARQLDGASSAE